MTPWVQRLLIANVIVYFLQQTVAGLTGQLAFVPALMLLRPWTIVTYMFLHGSFTHILFNMLALYFFGGRVEQRLGSRNFVTLYLVSGVAGALLSFTLQPYASVIGASGALYGVLLAYARFWPRDQMMIWGIIPVEARWLVVIYTGLSLMGAFGGGGSGSQGIAHFAHLGGFAGAFLYLLYLERQHGARRFQRTVAAAAPAPDALGRWQQVNRESVHSVNRDEVNRILDKISASGLKSLTPQERTFLSNFVPMDDRPKPIPPS